ncbi:hypothetical protein INT46_002272 [Mucor plumbeus]|uniref:C2H2-type domain-containing protein n=1 Tax=Mucor plumbeus TaxID=97098 RepID=A0A8H7RLY6_9FUNG|nr:hypothetical protein INT46_002272 [Mucor plumbeus]
MENYILNASFSLGNSGQDQQYTFDYGTSTASSTASSSCSSIGDFNFLNQSFPIDICTPDTTVYNEGSPSYPFANNDILDYFLLPTPTYTPPEKPLIKSEYDNVDYFNQKRQLQPPDMIFFDKSQYNQRNQEFHNSPESMFSVTSSSFSINSKEDLTPPPPPSLPLAAAAAAAAATAAEVVALNQQAQGKHEKLLRQKVFPCNYCNRSFARKYDAARHKRIHTGTKPYSCPCCNKGFARSDARVRHFRTEFNCRDGPDKIQGRHRNYSQKT